MAFLCQALDQKEWELIELYDSETPCKIEVIPAFGAHWHGFHILTGKGWLNLMDSYNHLHDLQENIGRSFKNVKLSPFPCRIRDGSYIFDGRKLEFKKKFSGNDAAHGLLFNQPFEILEMTGALDFARLRLIHHYQQEDAGFPFSYDCEVIYLLTKNSHLSLQTLVTNRSPGNIPMADGWHPYFRTGSSVDQVKLQFQALKMIEFDQGLIPTGKCLPYQVFQEFRELGPLCLDHSFILDFARCQPLCRLYDPQEQITLDIYPDSSYPILQIFTPDHRNSIAIECLSSPPDSFNNLMGLKILGPGETVSFQVAYQAGWGRD
ncbi:MAG: aldose epimerase family protein [Chitinophagaceae bacterium]